MLPSPRNRPPHAAASVIVFGNPKLGNRHGQTPLLAIDVPLKALVWRTIKARLTVV